MKKILVIVTILVLILVSGCKNPAAEATLAPPVADTLPTESKETSAAVENFSWLVTEPDMSSYELFFLNRSGCWSEALTIGIITAGMPPTRIRNT